MLYPVIVPFHPRTTSVQLWVGHQYLAGLPAPWLPVGSTVRVHGPGGVVGSYLLDAWQPPVGKGRLRIRWCILDVTGLPPDTHYTASVLLPGGNEVTACQFDTLPGALFDLDEVEAGARPLTVALGSCFWVDGPSSGTLPQQYTRVYEQPQGRPHVKFLVGDQVYLDQPPSEFLLRKSTTELSDFLVDRYSKSIEALRDVLSRGANVCISDDHDFWNDFPNAPREAWLALHTNSDYRDEMKEQATAFLRAVQQARDVDRVDIGAEVSFFVADTRVNRKVGTTEFMHNADLDQLCTWLDDLTCPAVLVIGSPVFWPSLGIVDADKYVPWWAIGLSALIPGIGPGVAVTLGALVKAVDAKGLTSDRNLAAYDQFAKLSRALTGARHDVLVLTGDIHYGRVSSVRVAMRDGTDPTRIWEVVSSPLSLLDGAAPGKDELLNPSHPFLGPPPPKVDYSGYADKRVATVNPVLHRTQVKTDVNADDRVQDHFTTLQFLRPRQGPGVLVRVKAWAADAGGNPRPVMDTELVLDGGRLVPSAVPEQRAVTHVWRRKRRIVGLVSPGHAWSPRLIGEVKRDIESGAATYHVFGRPVAVVESARAEEGFYLRVLADETGENNLGRLPGVGPRDYLN